MPAILKPAVCSAPEAQLEAHEPNKAWVSFRHWLQVCRQGRANGRAAQVAGRFPSVLLCVKSVRGTEAPTWHTGTVRYPVNAQNKPWAQSFKDTHDAPGVQAQRSGQEPHTSGNRQQRQHCVQEPLKMLAGGCMQNLSGAWQNK